MNRRRRRLQPGGDDLLTAADVANLDTAAARCRRDATELAELAAAGRFSPWTADRCPERGWVFHPRITAHEIETQLAGGTVWVPNIAEEICGLTVEWAAEHADIAATAQLFDWLRSADDPLDAGSEQWMWWCCYAPTHIGGRPVGAVIAARWEITCMWYDMLTESGIGHNCPHLGTHITVAHTTETPDTDTATSIDTATSGAGQGIGDAQLV